MMRGKLSQKQEEAMAIMTLMTKNWRSSYELGISLNTLQALEKRGLIRSKHNLGSMFSPRTAILWRKESQE